MVFYKNPGRFGALAAPVADPCVDVAIYNSLVHVFRNSRVCYLFAMLLVHAISQRTEVACMGFTPHKSAFCSDLMPWCFFQVLSPTHIEPWKKLLFYSFPTVKRFYCFFLTA